MKYLHIRVKGHPRGYYEESRAWDIALSVPQSQVRFLAGPFSCDDVKELRAKSREQGRRPLPIYD